MISTSIIPTSMQASGCNFEFQYKNFYNKDENWQRLEDQDWCSWWLFGSRECKNIETELGACELWNKLKFHYLGHPQHKFRVVDKNGNVSICDSTPYPIKSFFDGEQCLDWMIKNNWDWKKFSEYRNQK